MFPRLQTLLSLLVLTILMTDPVRGQDGAAEDDFDRSPNSCIRLSDIRETTIVDDESILFHMRRNRVYRNFLESSCPGLARRGRFSYSVRGGRLCSIDRITVPDPLDDRLGEGMTCRLGMFQPITQEEAARIEDGPDAVADLVITDIEVPSEGENGADLPAPTESESESE